MGPGGAIQRCAIYRYAIDHLRSRGHDPELARPEERVRLLARGRQSRKN